MPLQPAFEIVLEAHGHAVTLKASLRAAVAIDAIPGGFPKVWEQIAQQSVTAIRAVINNTATDRQDEHTFLVGAAGQPLSRSLPEAQAACLAVLASIMPEPTTAPQSPATASDAMPLRDYFQALFGYATGWLGWTPAETWAASPAEIEAAFAAHVDRLVKMTPGMSSDDHDRTQASPQKAYTPERLQQIEELGHDPAFDRVGFARLKAQAEQR